MNTIIEQALQLPKEEKIELFFALQQDLNIEDEFGETGLTETQWNEWNEISEEIEAGRIKKISEDEMTAFLKERRNGL